MTPCPYCGRPAELEHTAVLESTDGPVLGSRWRCLSDFTHWWTGVTDAPAGEVLAFDGRRRGRAGERAA
jgi:hypothetical protein